LVDAILHVRVASFDGPVLLSVRPDCAGRVVLEYSLEVLGNATGRGRASPGKRQVFIAAKDSRLEVGQQYLALLWPDGRATADLFLPIVSGRVASPSAGELNGMRYDDAMRVLGKWSREPRHR
jgi:hypothetical protein